MKHRLRKFYRRNKYEIIVGVLQFAAFSAIITAFEAKLRSDLTLTDAQLFHNTLDGSDHLLVTLNDGTSRLYPFMFNE